MFKRLAAFLNRQPSFLTAKDWDDLTTVEKWTRLLETAKIWQAHYHNLATMPTDLRRQSPHLCERLTRSDANRLANYWTEQVSIRDTELANAIWNAISLASDSLEC